MAVSAGTEEMLRAMDVNCDGTPVPVPVGRGMVLFPGTGKGAAVPLGTGLLSASPLPPLGHWKPPMLPSPVPPVGATTLLLRLWVGLPWWPPLLLRGPEGTPEGAGAEGTGVSDGAVGTVEGSMIGGESMPELVGTGFETATLESEGFGGSMVGIMDGRPVTEGIGTSVVSPVGTGTALLSGGEAGSDGWGASPLFE